MTDTSKYQAQSNELSQKLWAISNELRGQMDASEFKNYILGVIFYRFLSCTAFALSKSSSVYPINRQHSRSVK